MKKNTINRMLLGIIAILIVIICILIYKIASRPTYTFTEHTNNTVVADHVTNVDIPEVPASTIFETTQEPTTPAQTTPEPSTPAISEVLRGKTSDRVNIRELPSEEARVLETVEAGYTFDIIEIFNKDWVKIQYQEQEAYISSMFVIIIQ